MFVPVILFPQKTTKDNLHMFNMISTLFKYKGIPSFISEGSGVTTLRVEGVMATKLLLSLFVKYEHFGYWKVDRIRLLIEFF
jgi:hypothetical protein